MELLRFLQVENPQDRDAHVQAHAGLVDVGGRARVCLADLRGEDVPVVIAELPGDDFEGLGM